MLEDWNPFLLILGQTSSICETDQRNKSWSILFCEVSPRWAECSQLLLFFFLSRTFRVQLFVDVNMRKLNLIICSLVADELLFFLICFREKSITAKDFVLTQEPRLLQLSKCDGVIEALDYSLKPLHYTHTHTEWCVTAVFTLPFLAFLSLLSSSNLSV